MDENKTTNTNPESGAGAKTFSQDDVNRIVGERLAAEKRKGEVALAEREQQLAQLIIPHRGGGCQVQTGLFHRVAVIFRYEIHELIGGLRYVFFEFIGG